ncbi:TVP38/TMEM64 family protein [Paenibacillus hamazuiensis]|uniref:TVP38/TMEM64 family protein n=1 Tax=Paenibacillus hamazuiensis TaxID=2936508 RepID=UPI00200CCFA7|nr:TVP38/TMEM64 family protein [Paenibacillus hamazuiensis]
MISFFKHKSVKAGLYILAALLIGFAVYELFYTRHGVRLTHMNIQHLSDVLKDMGTVGKALGIALVYVQTVVPFVPFVVVAGANVILFGLWEGFLINWVMSCLGAITAFFIARYFASDWVERKLEKYSFISEFNKKLERSGFVYIAISRIIPVLPSFAINLGAGVMKVSARNFILGTIVGKFPMILLESYIGHDLLHFRQNKDRLLILLAVLIALVYIGSFFKKKLFGKK